MDFAPVKLTADEPELRRLALAAGELHGRAMDEFFAVYQRSGNDLAAVVRHYLSVLRERHLITAAEHDLLGKAADVVKASADGSHVAREVEKLCGKTAAGEDGASLIATLLAGIFIDSSRPFRDGHPVFALPRANWVLADAACGAAGSVYGFFGGPAGALAGGLAGAIGGSIGAVI